MNSATLSMPNAFISPGWPRPLLSAGRVPDRYFGVWSRTLLKTPETCETSAFVRWMQLGEWHVDLRVSPNVGGTIQGFSGTTKVTEVGGREICRWQRLVDIQPPRASLDEGWMVFETPNKLLETGIHGAYFEEWDRLPGSTGRRIALAEQKSDDGTSGTCLFVSGEYMMRVRPATPLSPSFEISFGKFSSGQFSIETSTLPGLSGTCSEISLSKVSEGVADVSMNSVRSGWKILEWEEVGTVQSSAPVIVHG